MDLAVLVASELKTEALKHDSAEEMFRAVAPLAHEHWMVLDKDKQFRGAVGAVVLALDEQGKEEAKAAVMKEIGMLNSLAAAISGVPVDMERAFEQNGEFKPIGLMSIWHETDPEA